MKPIAFVAVNGKRRLPVAMAPRRDLLTVPVWDFCGGLCSAVATLHLNFFQASSAPSTKMPIGNTLSPVCITKDVRFGFRLGLGASI